MDRRLLFPVVAVTAWAQQTAPAPSKAEKALRSRVDKFYQLLQDKKFRQSEAYVAEESKDFYYGAPKGNVLGFSITGVEFVSKSQARVKLKVKQMVLVMGAGPKTMELEQTTYWKLERGHWSWYLDRDAALTTPFGKLNPGPGTPTEPKLDRKGEAPPLSSIERGVVIDKAVVDLSKGQPDDLVTISNNLPGPIQLDLDPHVEMIPGVSVKIEHPALNSGEKAEVRFHRTEGPPIIDIVRITVKPLNKLLEIRLTTN